MAGAIASAVLGETAAAAGAGAAGSAAAGAAGSALGAAAEGAAGGALGAGLEAGVTGAAAPTSALGAGAEAGAAAGAAGAEAAGAGTSFLQDMAAGYSTPISIPHSFGQAAGQLLGLRNKGLSGSLSDTFLQPVIQDYNQKIQNATYKGGTPALTGAGAYVNQQPLAEFNDAIGTNLKNPFTFGKQTPLFVPASNPEGFGTAVNPIHSGRGILTGGILSGLYSGRK